MPSRLLMIGHDSHLRDELAREHALASAEIETCPTAIDALGLLRARAFDVVITDPSVSFREDLSILEAFRQTRPGVRTILLAPTAEPGDVVEALRAHAFACFTAPFDVPEIADLARRASEEDDWSDGIEVVSGLPHWITLKVTCRLITAERLVRFMTEHQRDVGSDDRFLLMAAFREMLINAMEHGCGFNPEKVIEVSAARTARTIVYHFRDSGPGFDRSSLSHAAVSNPSHDQMAHMDERDTQGLRPGGFGMLIVKHIVDEVIYNERGNEVLLIKHLDQPIVV